MKTYSLILTIKEKYNKIIVDSVNVRCYYKIIITNEGLKMKNKRLNLKDVKTLIKNGMIDMRSAITGMTVLMLACQKGHKKAIELLIEGGADVNIVDIKGNTALMHAITTGNKEIVELLIARGADVNISNNDNLKSLPFALCLGHMDIVNLLLESGFSLKSYMDKCLNDPELLSKLETKKTITNKGN